MLFGLMNAPATYQHACGVYTLYVENADYAIMLIYYVMLCLVRLSSSPHCSSCLNCNPVTYCVDLLVAANLVCCSLDYSLSVLMLIVVLLFRVK